MRCGVVTAGESARAEQRVTILWGRVSSVSTGHAVTALASDRGFEAARARWIGDENFGCSCGASDSSLDVLLSLNKPEYDGYHDI